MSSDSNHFDHPDVGTLAAVIAHSQIMIAPVRTAVHQLPAGFDQADIAILEWIAAEGRGAGRQFARM